MGTASRFVVGIFFALCTVVACGADSSEGQPLRICQQASQDDWMQIDCGVTETGRHRFVSEIRYARFGQLNRTCPWPRTTMCTDYVGDTVKEVCLNKSSCTLKADPSTLGIVDDPCADVPSRSLAVVVLCSDPAPNPTDTSTESPTESRVPTPTQPTHTPTAPTHTESPSHTRKPSRIRTGTPTPSHTRKPSRIRTGTPTPSHTRKPSRLRTATPTSSPTHRPSRIPIGTPTPSHTRRPSRIRTSTATVKPSRKRTVTRTARPLKATLKRTPTRTRKPTLKRTPTRSRKPTPFPKTLTPTRKPTRATPDRSSITPRPVTTPSNRTLCSRCIQYTLGAPEFVKDPDFSSEDAAYYPDQAFVAIRLANGEFRGYSALGGTDLIVKGPRLTDRVMIELNIKGDAPNYYTHDMEAAWYDPEADVVRGWVHIETNSCGGGMFHGEIYYVESDDHGLTFYPEKCRYHPHQPYRDCRRRRDFGKNVTSPDWAITSASPYFKNPNTIAATGTANTGTGAHFGLLVGDYYHVYYTDYWAEFIDAQGRTTNRHGICLARAHKSTRGRPGSFKKFYRGAFSEDGVKGKCSPVANISGSAVTTVPMSNTGEWVYASVPPNWAGYMSVSLDGVKFDRLNGPLLPGFNVAPGQPANQWFMGYLSIVVDENDQPYLYAMAVLSDVGIRNIIRYPLTYYMSPNPSVCGGRITLTRFKSRTTNDVAVQFQPKEPSKWISMGGVAYSSLCNSRTVVKLVECYIRTSRLHFLAQESECAPRAHAPDGTSNTMALKGAAGFIKTEFQSGLVALYRCWFPQQRHFDVIAAPGTARHPCESQGGISQKLLGYAMPLGSSSATFSSGNSFYDPSWMYDMPDSTLIEPIAVPTFGAQNKIPKKSPTPLAKQQRL